MFRLFWRARAPNFLGMRLGGKVFRARSAERDLQTDRQRVGSIMSAIETALSEAKNEQAGLTKRVDDALARASVTFGNGTDEYLGREPLDNYHQDLFAAEIENGQRRLGELASMIAHLEGVKAAMLTHFPNLPQQN
ncbi:hypothetical protein [Bradyrhizobium sp. STM 3562]|uniref:hypothetical protein n=1 Tax=Bradyrhizobium sp. STM 3562 TaxID=578924 RepID=UPI00388FD3FF